MEYVTYKSKRISHSFVLKQVEDLEIGDLIFEPKGNGKLLFRGQVFRKKEYNLDLPDEYVVVNNYKGETKNYTNPHMTVTVLTID